MVTLARRLVRPLGLHNFAVHQPVVFRKGVIAEWVLKMFKAHFNAAMKLGDGKYLIRDGRANGKFLLDWFVPRGHKAHGKYIAFLALLVTLLVTISACTTTSGSYCAINRPLVYSDAVIDQMSDAEVERTLAALETHRRLCGRKR